MKITRFVLVILLLSAPQVYAKSAPDTVVDYINVLKQKDYNASAAFFDPAALQDFRQMMGFANEIPAEGQQAFYRAIFGPRSTRESVSKLSNAAFFASFLRTVMSRAEAAGGMNLEGMEILGEIKEGANLSHVVTRNRISFGKIELEAMEVVSLVKKGKEWKLTLSGKLRGIAMQIRAAFSSPRQQR